MALKDSLTLDAKAPIEAMVWPKAVLKPRKAPRSSNNLLSVSAATPKMISVASVG